MKPILGEFSLAFATVFLTSSVSHTLLVACSISFSVTPGFSSTGLASNFVITHCRWQGVAGSIKGFCISLGLRDRVKGAERVVVGISGASGVIYGVRLVTALSKLGYHVDVVISDAAAVTARYELDKPLHELLSGAGRIYSEKDIDAPMASGSYLTRGMVIAPCSMKTLAAIAHGLELNLLIRAAMVHLKEKRPLVLLIRESPLSVPHIENMLKAARAGAIVMPASPSFYGSPKTVTELVDNVVGRVLDILGVENELVNRWAGSSVE
jgi:polyprenyl P-hydroxybenzoate/phenylacrylic acid decarboxylase-like protein